MGDTFTNIRGSVIVTRGGRVNTDEVLVIFELGLARAPSIHAAYVMVKEKWLAIKGKLERHAEVEYSFGELQGKHSDTCFTGKRVLGAVKATDDLVKIAAFRTLYGNESHVTYDVLEGLEEAWANLE